MTPAAITSPVSGCSTSNDGDHTNMFVDMHTDFDSDPDHDDDNPRETNQRGTFGESDLGGTADPEFNSCASVISMSDIFEDKDGNENNIVAHKISVISQQSDRRKTNVMREGQNEGNDSHDSDVSL